MKIPYSPDQLDELKVFNVQPNVEPYRTKEMDGTLWVLTNKPFWTVYFKLNKHWVRLDIRDGQISDLASIPWIAQVFLKKGKDGVHRIGSKLHDFIYEQEKYLKDGELYAKIPHTACTHECYIGVGGNWIPFDVLISKKQADRLMFDVIKTTPRAYISRWKISAMMLAFKSFIAHRMWRKETPLHIMNPKQCRKNGRST